MTVEALGDLRPRTWDNWEENPDDARIACATPEAPPTIFTVFELDCPACLIALRAALTVEPRPGEFRGYYDTRDEAMSELAKRGITLP